MDYIWGFRIVGGCFDFFWLCSRRVVWLMVGREMWLLSCGLCDGEHIHRAFDVLPLRRFSVGGGRRDFYTGM